MLQVGELAPDFELPDQQGKSVKLSQLKGKSHVVIFFYPKDNTPGCTAQSCSFRDNYSGFRELNTEIIGISSDSINSHASFASEHNLPFPILSDADKRVRKLYQVKNTLGVLPARATFVVDKAGVIRFALSSQMNIQQHIDKSLEMIRSL